MDRDDRTAAQHGQAFPREIQRHNGYALHVDVKPDVQLRPIREWKDSNALAFIQAGIENVPQLRPLILGVPLAQRIAEGVDALLGPRFLLVAARAAERRIEAALSQSVQERFGLEQAAALL